MYKQHQIGNQHGGLTLAMTVILLFVMTLVTLYAAKTSIKEQQISANQYRADQSLSTADAALNWGLANYIDIGGKFCDKRLEDIEGAGYTCPTEAMCTIYTDDTDKCKFAYTKSAPLKIGPGRTEDALSIGASEMYYAFIDGGVEFPYIKVEGVPGETYVYGTTTRIFYAPVKVVGTGHSDDETGRRVVSVDIEASNIFGDPGLGASAFPLISKSTIAPNANVKIINRYDNRTIWSGNEVVISGSTETYVLLDGLGWNCNDIKNHADCVTAEEHSGVPLYTMAASDDVFSVNADVIDADTNLANLDPNKFFENFFGKTKKQMKALAKETGLYVEAIDKKTLKYKDGSGKKVDIDWNGLADYTPLVWIDAPYGYEPAAEAVEQLGTEGDPMVLIIDGNLSVGTNSLILVGALYVTGTWDATAAPIVQGMLVVESEAGLLGGGTPTLIYDADLFSGKMGPPPGTVAGTTPGSWKDWE